MTLDSVEVCVRAGPLLLRIDANDRRMGHRFIDVEVDIGRSFLYLGYSINEDCWVGIVVGAGKFQLTPLYLAPEPFCRVVGIEYICRIPIAGTLRTRGANDERSHLTRDIALAVAV